MLDGRCSAARGAESEPSSSAVGPDCPATNYTERRSVRWWRSGMVLMTAASGFLIGTAVHATGGHSHLVL